MPKSVKKRKKSKKRLSLSRVEARARADGAALMDRILVGLDVMSDPDEFGTNVAMYVLNPGLRGEELMIGARRIHPAFMLFDGKRDALMRQRTGIEGDVVPFWMGRFTALTEDDLLFGWMTVDSRGVVVRVVGFDYSLIGELHGDDFAEYIGGLPRALRIPRMLVSECLKLALVRATERANCDFHFEDMQGIDPGPGLSYTSAGGDA